jgi:hypothetical protein
MIWAKQLPSPTAGTERQIYDGTFKGLPGGGPFNWKLVDDAGVLSEIATAPDGRSALHVVFPTWKSIELAEQLLVLPPGPYRLSGRVLLNVAGPREELVWRLTCVDSDGAPLVEVRQVAVGEGWHDFGMGFIVPELRCGSQRLQLSGVAQEDSVTGTGGAWYTDLSLHAASSDQVG